MSHATKLSSNHRFAREPDMTRLSAAYAKRETDWPRALSEFKALADQGSIMSMLYVADSYGFGIGTPINREEHERWLRRAKDAGSASAAYKLGVFYLDAGKYDEAIDNLLFAASLDFPPALARMGYLYAKAQGVAFDKVKARDFLERANSRGHLYSKRLLAALLIREDFGVFQKLRGLMLYFTIPWTISRIAYRHSKLSDDASSMKYMDEQLH